MTRTLTLALLMSSLGLPVLAADALEGSLGGQCPQRKAASNEQREETPNGDSTTNRAAQQSRSGGEAAANPPRNRPRWQSFLPGMIR